MSYQRPPSHAAASGGGLFRRLANATQVQSILADNDALRGANAYCKAETEKARLARSVAIWETLNLRAENEELKRQVAELTETCKRTRQCLTAGEEKQTVLLRTLDLRAEEAKVYHRELEEVTRKHEMLGDEKKTLGKSVTT